MHSMPVRRLISGFKSPLASTSSQLSVFLVPFLLQSQQRRSASILSDLANAPASYHKKKRVGRGPSSGFGKTSGRGHKGQKARGSIRPGFEGGQTPLLVVKGYRGFDNTFSVDMSTVNLDKIQSWIDQGRIDPSQPITARELVKSRCIHGVKDGIKLLARNANALTTPIKILVSQASATAIEAVEAAGGSVTTRYYSRHSIRHVVKGLSQAAAFHPTNFDTKATNPKSQWKFRLPDPTSRKDIEYYRDPAHRGYLVDTVQEGEGPSLFFRPPNEDGKKVVPGKEKRKLAANKLF